MFKNPPSTMRPMRAGLLLMVIGCGACLAASSFGDRVAAATNRDAAPTNQDAAPALQTASGASKRWVHRYVPTGIGHYLPEQDRWVPESEEHHAPVTAPGMIVWEVSEYPPGSVPTPAQLAAGDDMIERCYEAALRHGWHEYDRGLADGYRSIDSYHYRNDEYMVDDHVIDPDRPEALMYIATPPDGQQHLAGIMFYAKNREARGPQFGGPLTIWHWHTWLRPQCIVDDLSVNWSVNGKCKRGVPDQYSGEMMHVWLVDHPVGPFGSPMFLPYKDLIAGLEKRFEERGF
jgi:hypothetical protein